MAEYEENYGQYSNQGQYSGLNIEDQSVAPPTTAQAASNVQYNAPPVQPMYTNDPQYQQGKAYWEILVDVLWWVWANL